MEGRETGMVGTRGGTGADFVYACVYIYIYRERER